jgi:hypothetical protein
LTPWIACHSEIFPEFFFEKLTSREAKEAFPHKDLFHLNVNLKNQEDGVMRNSLGFLSSK